MLSSINSDVLIVKNGSGNIYWPSFGVNNIGNMNPGEGYQIKMNNAATLTYPANSQVLKMAIFQNSKLNHSIKNTGSNMSLMIPETAWGIIPESGSEILVYSESNLLVGKGMFSGENTAITIWGDDETSSEIDGLQNDEPFTIKLLDGESEQFWAVESWLEGDDRYNKNKIAIAGSISVSLNQYQNEVILFQNVPNPFRDKTMIRYYLPEDLEIVLSVYNVLGERVEVLKNGRESSGLHSVSFSSKGQSSGIYYYKLELNGEAIVKRMDILR